MAGSVLRLILSHILVPGPRMAWVRDKVHIQEILHFGKWIVVSSVASFVSQQSDIVFFGFLLPSSALGIYSVAKMLVSSAEGLLERLVSSLALPVLSEVIRKDFSKVRNHYYRFRLPIDIGAALISGVLVATGGLIVHILYDTRYAQAGPILQVLAIGLAIYPFNLIRSAFTATGDTQVVAGVSIAQALSLIASITIGFSMAGAFGVIIGIAIHRLFPSAIIMFIAGKRNWISVWREMRIIPILIFGIVIGEVILMIARFFGITTTGYTWFG